VNTKNSHLAVFIIKYKNNTVFGSFLINFYHSFRTVMKEYKIGYVDGDAFKSSLSVTVGGEEVTLDSTYHYGAKIVVRATENVGRSIQHIIVNQL